MFASLEAEFTAIVNDVKSVPEKLEALMGFHAKTQAIESLAAPMTALLEDASKTTEQKVEELLHLTGKL